MGFFERRPRPAKVTQAIEKRDYPALSIMGAHGNIEKRERKEFQEEARSATVAEQAALNHEPKSWEEWEQAGGHSPDDVIYPQEEHID